MLVPSFAKLEPEQQHVILSALKVSGFHRRAFGVWGLGV